MANNTKKGFSPVLAFILGFLLALIILVGAVAGVVIFALNYKLDKLSFNKDEQGNYLYINADPENGGVATALDLIKKVSGLVKDTSTMTLGEFENVFPVTAKLTDGVHDALAKYIELDMEELKAVKFNALGDYLQDVVRKIRPADFVEGNELTDRIIGDITLGDLMDGTVDFEQIINDTEITVLIDIDPENKIMVYLGFGIKGLHNEDGTYIGKYELRDGTTAKCYLETEGNIVKGAYYFADGERVDISATTVDGMNPRLNNIRDELALSDVMDIKAPTDKDNNAVMLFLAYSVAEVKATDNGTYTGLYKPDENTEIRCTIECHGGFVTDVYYEENGEKSYPEYTSISGVSSQVTKLTKTLTLREVIDIDENDKVMNKLGDFIIEEVGGAVDTLTLDDFIDVEISYAGDEIKLDTSEVVLAYVVYGLTDIREEHGVIKGTYNPVKYKESNEEDKKRTYDAVINTEIKDGKTVISEVFADIDDEPVCVSGCSVNKVSDRVGGVTTDIEIGQLMEVEDNKILRALRHSTVDSLPTDIDKLSINELYYEDIYKTDESEAVMRLAVAGEPADDTEIQFNPQYLYYVKVGENDYEMYNAGKENAGKVDEFKAETYYTYGKANETWKLLLYETNTSDEGEHSTERAYSVNSMDALIKNVKTNVRRTALYDLEAAEVIKMGDDLNTIIIYEGKRTYLGNLTLEQLLNFFVEIVPAAPATP